jgi:hypothetical protein
MATMGALSPRSLTDLDWHRLLDATVLISRAGGLAGAGQELPTAHLPQRRGARPPF